MQQHPFTLRQMFQSKQVCLEKRITAYYEATGETTCVIKLIRLLQIRARLKADISAQPGYALIRQGYLNTRVTRGMKRYVYYFRDYFSETEWKGLLVALFPVLPRLVAWEICWQILYQVSLKERGTVP